MQSLDAPGPAATAATELLAWQELKTLRAQHDEDTAALAASREQESELTFVNAQLQDQVSLCACQL